MATIFFLLEVTLFVGYFMVYGCICRGFMARDGCAGFSADNREDGTVLTPRVTFQEGR